MGLERSIDRGVHEDFDLTNYSGERISLQRRHLS
jgi:hypothetical protein